MKLIEDLSNAYSYIKFLAEAGRSTGVITVDPGKGPGESNPPPGTLDPNGFRARKLINEFEKMAKDWLRQADEFKRAIEEERMRELLHQCYFRNGWCVICKRRTAVIDR